LQRSKGPNRPRGRRTITCYSCREEGHIACECPRRTSSGGTSQVSKVSPAPAPAPALNLNALGQ
jgi:hypothetical protein